MQEEKSERKTDIDGNVKNGAIVSGDNNNVFNLVYNFIYKQTDTKLSAGFVHLITLLTFAVFSLIVIFVLVKIVLLILHSAEIKINILNFIILFFSLLLAWSFIFKFINNFKILIIILIPLCMAFSVASAAYILDENVLHVIERIISFSDENKSDIECQTEPDFPVNPLCGKTYNEIKVERPEPKPEESVSTVIQDISDSGKPSDNNGRGRNTSTSQLSKKADKYEPDNTMETANKIMVNPMLPEFHLSLGYEWEQIHNFYDFGDEDWIKFDVKYSDKINLIFCSEINNNIFDISNKSFPTSVSTEFYPLILNKSP